MIEEAFVSKSDHVVGVDGLDIRRHLFRPLRHDRNIAAVASGLICKLPAELEYCQHRKTTKCKTDNILMAVLV